MIFEMREAFALPFERVHDKVGWTSLFQRYWYHSITVSLLYYVFVRLLQRLMRDRQPFQLRVPLIVWNFVLAIFSFAGLVRFSEFLHYYHHAAVFVYTIHSGTEHTAPGQAFISMNFLAHSAMYSYYTAKSCGIKVPRIIAMAVTSIQTAQMFLGVAVSTLVLKLKLLDGYR
uniref:Elongation of very long chain fatty acids protein n=1 Tax=Meloidogyne javanica TaxID=6303 RepID=A0A915MR34_MELJA